MATQFHKHPECDKHFADHHECATHQCGELCTIGEQFHKFRKFKCGSEVTLVTILANGQTITNSSYTTVSNSVTIQMQNYYTNGYIFYTLDGTTPRVPAFIWAVSVSLPVQSFALWPTLDFEQSVISDLTSILILPSYTLTPATAGGGTIVLSPVGHVCNTTVITATPATGWTFLEWLGDIAGTNATNTVLMSRNKAIQAVFGTTVGSTVGGNGSVLFDPAGGIYPYGTTLQASALPLPGNVFVLWGNAASGNTNPLSYVVTNPNPVISSLFTSLGGGQVSLAVVPIGHGRVSVSPRANGYTAGQSVTITATPDAGKTFNGWSGDASGSQNPLPVTLNTSKTIYATFSTNNSLSFRVGPGQGFSEGVEVDINGETGTHYLLESSTNLSNWIPLLNLTDYVGVVHYIDTSATNLDRRFYRAVILP